MGEESCSASRVGIAKLFHDFYIMQTLFDIINIIDCRFLHLLMGHKGKVAWGGAEIVQNTSNCGIYFNV